MKEITKYAIIALMINTICACSEIEESNCKSEEQSIEWTMLEEGKYDSLLYGDYYLMGLDYNRFEPKKNSKMKLIYKGQNHIVTFSKKKTIVYDGQLLGTWQTGGLRIKFDLNSDNENTFFIHEDSLDVYNFKYFNEEIDLDILKNGIRFTYKLRKKRTS